MNHNDNLISIPAFVDEIRSHGAVFNKIEVHVVDKDTNEHGIFACDRILKGEEIISVPWNLCISIETMLQHPLLKVIFEDIPGLLEYPDEILAIGISYARLLIMADQSDNINCSWLNHVRTFPQSFNTPLYWSNEEIEELRPCTVYHLTKLLKNQISNDWSNIHEPLIQNYPDLLSGYTKDIYLWSLSIIYSRAVGFQRKGKYSRCIPPVLDMANHHPDIALEASQTFVFNDDLDVLSLVSTKEYRIGEECYAYYGSYPNAKLLLSYGFVLRERPNRAIDLWTKLSDSSFAASIKHKILDSNPLTKNQMYDFEGTIREFFVSPKLLATIRVIQISDEEELERASNAFLGRMISVRNELASYVALKNLIISRMMVASAESDKVELGQRLLDEETIVNRKTMALVVRCDERDLLHVSSNSMICGILILIMY